MARFTVSADSLDELAEALAEILGGEAAPAGAGAAAGTEAPKRGRRKKAEAPDPVNPTGAPDNAAGAAGNVTAAGPGFDPTGGAAAATAAAAPFNPAGAGAAAAPFNPAGAAAGPSETFTKVKAHLEAMAGQHGPDNVYNWVKQVLADPNAANASPAQIRDTVLPTLTDAQLADLYTKSGGK